MSLYDGDPVLRRAEEIAQRYADLHGHQPVTEERAAQMWDEGPAGYTGRRRANEDGTPARVKPAVCPDADGHAIGYPDVTVWVRHRRATGECADCGGMVP